MTLQHLEARSSLTEPHSMGWQWPRAALGIFLMSLLLWAGIAAAVALAFS